MFLTPKQIIKKIKLFILSIVLSSVTMIIDIIFLFVLAPSMTIFLSQYGIAILIVAFFSGIFLVNWIIIFMILWHQLKNI